MRKLLYILYILIILILGITLNACMYNKKEVFKSATIKKNDAKNLINVLGIVKSKDTKNITMDIVAKIKQIHVLEGQKLKKNEPIITFDLSDYLAVISKLESELTIAKKELSNILETNNLAKNEISYLYTNLNTQKDKLSSNKDQQLISLKTKLTAVEEVYQKSLKSVDDNVVKLANKEITQAEYDKSKVQAETDKANRDSIQSEINKYNQTKNGEITSLETKINEKVTSLKKTQPNIALAILSKNEAIKQIENNITNMKNKMTSYNIDSDVIKCDIDNGLIKEIAYTVGDIVSPVKKLYTIYNLDQLIVEAYIPEELVKEVKVGDKAKIVPVADRKKSYQGKINYISNATTQYNNESVMIAEITLDRTDGFLMPMYNTEIEIEKNGVK